VFAALQSHDLLVTCRAKLQDEPVFKKNEAARAAAMAKCITAPRKPAGNPYYEAHPEKNPERMATDVDADGAEPTTSGRQARGRSRHRDAEGSSAALAAGAADAALPDEPAGDVDMTAAELAKAVRGPNQYKCAFTSKLAEV
jgi:hypothetical protein